MRILELFHGGFPVTQVAFKVNELEHAVVCAAVSGWIAFALEFAIFAVLLAGTISEALIERLFRLSNRLVRRTLANSGSAPLHSQTSRNSLRASV